MTEPERTPFVDHPLLADRPRLDKIIDNMHVTIQKVLFRTALPVGGERALAGGESSLDVLQDALLALLRYDPAQLRTTWEALSVTIARNRARSAIDRATKGRRPATTPADAPDEISVVSLDEVGADRPEENEGSNPEATFMRQQQQLVILRLARQLDDRKRLIFFGIHYQERSKKDIGDELGITGQAVGQMYVKITSELLAEAEKDQEYPTLRGTPEGRTK